MKTYWMFWWGRTANPLRQLNLLHWFGVLLIVVFFSAFCWLPEYLAGRAVTCVAVLVPIWAYWVSQIKKMSVPVNLLVPQLQRRLLQTSMAHWLIATVLFAFAATIRDRLDHFFTVGLLLGCGLLVFAWLASLRSTWMAIAGGIGLILGLSLIAVFLHWNDHPDVALAILVTGWMAMPVLAWLALNVLLRDGAARRLKMEQVRRKVPFREAMHHWFLRRLSRACSNTALRPAVLERVRLEARLNSSFGPEFHWSSYIFNLWPALLVIVIGSQRIQIAEGNFLAICSMFSISLFPNAHKFMENHRGAAFSYLRLGKLTTSFQLNDKYEFDNVVKPVDNTTVRLIKGLLFLAPGLPQGLALHHTRARIALRYFLIVWAMCMAVYALVSFVLPATIRFPVLTMLATADLTMIGRYIGSSPSNWAVPWLPEWKRMPRAISMAIFFVIYFIWPTNLSKYVLLLLILAPDWYLASISLPLWSASCLLGGGAFLYLRWKKLATEPEGLPADWR